MTYPLLTGPTDSDSLPADGDDSTWINRRATETAQRAANARKGSGRRRLIDPATCERDYSRRKWSSCRQCKRIKRRVAGHSPRGEKCSKSSSAWGIRSLSRRNRPPSGPIECVETREWRLPSHRDSLTPGSFPGVFLWVEMGRLNRVCEAPDRFSTKSSVKMRGEEGRTYGSRAIRLTRDRSIHRGEGSQ